MNKDHEQLRKELWIKVAVAVAGASNASYVSSMTSWADEALKEFDKRFKEKKDDK